MSKKTEEQLRRDGFFVTLEAMNKAGVENIVTAYNMGREEPNDVGLVLRLEAQVRDYREEVRGINRCLCQVHAQHGAKMEYVRNIVANMRAEINRLGSQSAAGPAPSERPFLAFFAALEKEVAK